MTSYNHVIDPVAHRRRCRAALELLQAAGPQLPQLGDRPRHYTDSRGRSYAWNSAVGYVSID